MVTIGEEDVCTYICVLGVTSTWSLFLVETTTVKGSSIIQTMTQSPSLNWQLQKEQQERVESAKDKPAPHIDDKLKAQIAEAAK